MTFVQAKLRVRLRLCLNYTTGISHDDHHMMIIKCYSKSHTGGQNSDLDLNVAFFSTIGH